MLENDFSSHENHDLQIKGNGFPDKVSFIVGFSALMFALYPFKERMIQIKIYLFAKEFNLYTLAAFLILLLFISTYLYGLNYIRYDSQKLLSWKWLKIIEIGAQSFYIFAFCFPLLILFLWISTIFTHWILEVFPKGISQDVLLAPSVSVTIGALLSFFFSFSRYRRKEYILYKKLLQREKELFNNADQVYQRGDLDMAIIKIFQSAVAAIKSNLISEIGLGAERLSTTEVIELAKRKKIISEEEHKSMQDLRILRNQLTHNTNLSNISSRETQSFIDRINTLVNKLEKRKMTYVNSYNNGSQVSLKLRKK